jgi:hypothetical protein
LQLFVDDYERMIIAEGEDWTGFARVQTETLKLEDLTGAWLLQTDRADGPLGEQPQLFMLTVLEDGHFMLGGQENDATCVPGGYPAAVLEQDGNGVEYGELSLTAVPGLVVPQNVTVDSNGECGFFDATKGFQQRYFVIPHGDALTVWANDEEEDLSGLVFKRAPSEPNGITGAWLWSEDGASADQFAVSVYLPGGVMFETSTLPDDFGIIRESFTYEGTTMTSQNAGYEYCVDTENAISDCEGDPESRIIETYIVEGDTVVDEEGNPMMTRISSPAP